MPADSAQPSRAAFFDHDAPRGRRTRRPAPDWGGDDLFDHVPRRRFARTEDGAGRATGHDAGERAEDPAGHGRAARGGAAVLELAPDPAPAELRPSSILYAEPPPAGGRRTVTITGHPGRVDVLRRDRGPRTVEQRIHARPDRVAAWACALGVLLICMALLT